MAHLGSKAVVIGAGIGGLAAAGALKNHFDQVLILERDELPATVVQRAGIPHGNQPHTLLGGGQLALEALFPGLTAELVAAGAAPYRANADVRIERPGFDPFPQRDLGWLCYAMSRPFLEFHLRRRTKASGVLIQPRCRAQRIVLSADGSRVSGVEYATPGGTLDTAPAELVVDASGQGSPTLLALEASGSPLPEQTRIGVDFGYATAVFEVPDSAPTTWKVLQVFPDAPRASRGGVLMPLEHGRWIVGLGGRYSDKPPGDYNGFTAFARMLRTPTLYSAIQRAQRIGDVMRFGFKASVWRHFERLPATPIGLLPFADAICRFDPSYGQGMSVAALEASLLDKLLGSANNADPIRAVTSAFIARVSEVIEGAWASWTFADLAFPDSTGVCPLHLARSLLVSRALSRIAAEDPVVHKLIVEVQHLLRPRSDLKAPEIATRVAQVLLQSPRECRTRPT